MNLLEFILLFLFLWIIVMIIMAIFAILCIVFSALSAFKSKRFLASRQYLDYKSARGNHITALVFFIITCCTSTGTLLTLAAFIDIIADGTLSGEAVFNPTFLFVLFCSVLLAVALALGIRCFVWYGRAVKLNKQLSAVSVPPFSPVFPVAVQSFSVCPACGSANDIRNRFCVRCGQPIK